MENNPVEYTLEKLFGVFLKDNDKGVVRIDDKNFIKRAIIHTRTHDFGKFGEFEITKCRKIWLNTIKDLGLAECDINWHLFDEANCEQKVDDEVNFDGAADTANETLLLTFGRNWFYPVKTVKILSNHMNVFLVRDVTIKKLLNTILFDNDANELEVGEHRKFGHSVKDPKALVYIKPSVDVVDDRMELSLYRANIIRNVLANVLVYTKWTQVFADKQTTADVDMDDGVLKIEVCSVASKNFNKMESTKNGKYVRIICGLVTDLATKKASDLSYSAYETLRCNDMCLAAMHKYGVRDKRYTTLSNTLGRAAVPIDLLEVKHSSPVHTKRNGVSNTKGVVFILYNMARCDGLLREFEERITKRRNIKLPALDEIDFSLLKLEDEWNLVFNYIFAFPRLLNRCVERLDQGIFGVHLIIQFLSAFVADFSVYYHRYRILTDTREELMPLMFARIYLIKGLREILVTSLRLFNIEPIEIM